ncbi:MAG TPA: ECF transporter S component [Tepidimicrobium sp.]|nr:ECF transporter S component [Tepidimicrobium sp.]
MVKTRHIVVGALLTALALIIPISFGAYLKIYIPPFSATLASHVPTMISFLISPFSAVMVGLGSSLGFLLIMGPVVAARAFIHVFVGFAGATLVKRGYPFWKALLFTIPIHALGEALIVLPFGFDLYTAFVTVGIGTVIHHSLDSLIAISLVEALSKTPVKNLLNLS